MGLIGSILTILGIILYFGGYFSVESIVGILLIIIAIFSSFYVNKNIKRGSILLAIIGILIFFYSAGFLSPYQHISLYIFYVYSDWGYVLNPWDLLYLAGIILFFTGITNIIRNHE